MRRELQTTEARYDSERKNKQAEEKTWREMQHNAIEIKGDNEIQ